MLTKSPGSKGRLPKETLDWSLSSILQHDDNDLYSKPFEFQIFQDNWEQLVQELKELRVDRFRWSEARKMLLAKDRVSFRMASQLDPIDSLILTSIVKLLGNRIEKLRLPKSQVVSNRFISNSTSFYDTHGGWESFWKKSASLAASSSFVARTDITDFYSQLSHAEILRQLEACGSPERITDAIAGFLRAFSSNGQGVPIGPHATHLLAELSLTRADKLLESKNVSFIRYIDDYHLFCSDEESAQMALLELAEILANTFGLSLNRVKTSVTDSPTFVSEAKRRSHEDSMDSREVSLLNAIKEVTDSDYDFVDLRELLEHNPDAVSDEVVSQIFEDCLQDVSVDYPKMAWLLRRLSQVGAPGAIDIIVDRFDAFVPIIGEAARYLSHAGGNWPGEWGMLGDRILSNATRPIAKRSPYVEMVLYGLFATRKELNHVNSLVSRFDNVHPTSKRELVLSAKINEMGDWLYSLRTQAKQFDPWLTRAYVYALSVLPSKQAGECLAQINVEHQSSNSVLLGNLISTRIERREGDREPTGSAWKAIIQQVPKDRRAFVEDRLESLDDTLDQLINPDKSGQALIATWNLRNFGGAAFGFGSRLPESLAFIARAVLPFDLIAIQEVQSKELLDRLLHLLGEEWDKLTCGEAVGVEGNQEMMAFLFRHSKVKFLGHTEQLALGKSESIFNKHQFARPPFLAEFKLGGWKIVAGAAHIYYGAQSGDKLKRRVAEIDKFAEMMVKRGQKLDAVPILLGDLNVVSPDHATMVPLKKHRLALPDKFLTPTNAAGDKFFTQIAFLPIHDGPRLVDSGVFRMFDHVYKDDDLDKYRIEMESSAAWETSKRANPTASISIDFFRKWRTLQLSDHFPVWVNLG